jgi:hypothetical protein
MTSPINGTLLSNDLVRVEIETAAGRTREPQRSKSSGKDWSKAGTASGSAASNAGV